jgi:hypothetical protein
MSWRHLCRCRRATFALPIRLASIQRQDSPRRWICRYRSAFFSTGRWCVTSILNNNPVNNTNTFQHTGLEDSLSGSASSTDDDDESSEESDAVNALFQKNKKKTVSRSSSPDPSATERAPPQTAHVWFHSPPATQIGIYRALFPLGIELNAYVQTLREMQTPISEGRKWALFMVAGGHFAGAIARVSQDADAEEPEENTGKKKKPKKPKPETEVLRHKTFHRYTSKLVYSYNICTRRLSLTSLCYTSSTQTRRVTICQ